MIKIKTLLTIVHYFFTSVINSAQFVPICSDSKAALISILTLLKQMFVLKDEKNNLYHLV